jgi:hypothetical protein
MDGKKWSLKTLLRNLVVKERRSTLDVEEFSSQKRILFVFFEKKDSF